MVNEFWKYGVQFGGRHMYPRVVLSEVVVVAEEEGTCAPIFWALSAAVAPEIIAIRDVA